MSGKDARATVRLNRWKSWVSLVIGAALVVAISVIARSFWGPGEASAQTRGRNSNLPARNAAPRTPKQPARTAVRKAAPQSRATSNVMALVNSEPITRQELADETMRRYGAEVLESIVNKQLIWQACKTHDIAITEKDIDQEITRIAAKFGLSPGRWLEMLQEERGINHVQYRREIIWPTLALRTLATHQIEVTQKELDDALESEYGAKIRARIIAVGNRKKAEEVHAKAVADPTKFGDLAKEFSEDQSASVRGLIPPIRRHMGDPKLEQIAFGLKDGEVSPIIPIANQHVFIVCERRLPATFIAPQFKADAEARLHDRIRDQKLRSAAAELFQDLQKKAQVTNIWNNPELRRQMPGIAARINSGQVTIGQLAEECLVRHGEDVLDGEINRRLLVQALKRGGKTVADADIDREIARAADSYGFVNAAGAPDIDKWLEHVTEKDGASIDLYVRDAVWPTVTLKKLVGDRVQVSEEDLKRGFQSNFGERVEVLAIVLNSNREAQKVWEMARNNPTEQFFGQLAHQYSADPVSRENFGKVPPLRRFGGQPHIEKEAFELKAGELSGIIVSGDKYIVMRCVGRTKPIVASMDEQIRKELYADIHEKKLRLEMAREFDKLRENAQIDNMLAGTTQTGAAARAAAKENGTLRR